MTFTQLVNNSCSILREEGLRSFIRQAIVYLKYSGKLASNYEIYLEQNKITDQNLSNMRAQIKNFKYSPKISIITPVYNVDGIWLEKAINSVIDQVYENWELCLVDDASKGDYIKKMLDRYSEKDPRIKVKYLSRNQGISGASNEALSLATGEFAGFLDHDDELSVNALYEVVKLLQEHPEADMIYSDEDNITIDDKRVNPYFKPDWSPDLLLSNMYTCHFGIYRKNLIDEIGRFRKGFEGSQDYDLVLRVTEQTDKIFHIPEILYHWRQLPGSTSVRYQSKSYADISAYKALEEAIDRRKISGKVLPGRFPGFFRIKRDIIGEPLVSVIIPTKNKLKTLKKCIESIRKKTTYKNYEIIIIDNYSNDSRTLRYLESISGSPGITVLKYDQPFNFSAINNFAAQRSNGEYLLFLNNDTEVINEDWLSAILEHAQRPEVGAVGCKLLYPNGTIQHAGVILGIRGRPEQPGIAGHSYKHLSNIYMVYFKGPHVIHNLSAVTAACVLIRKKVFYEVGGFDENIEVAFNDVDLCLKIREKGYLITYTPYAELYHHESLSRGYENTPEKMKRFLKEYSYMREKWGSVIDKGDPYYNPNLTLIKEDFSIRI
ncbi:MAG: glycosyltransferase family 2 protein [Candidatus Methanoperedens sp.]|nr:glycosyltransferase family 2 protein [Candidatus Methanoperedens sp.]